jgi:hypothetical protein
MLGIFYQNRLFLTSFSRLTCKIAMSTILNLTKTISAQSTNVFLTHLVYHFCVELKFQKHHKFLDLVDIFELHALLIPSLILVENISNFLRMFDTIRKSTYHNGVKLILNEHSYFYYRKVTSSNTSRLEAHAGFFKLMNGIINPYVL